MNVLFCRNYVTVLNPYTWDSNQLLELPQGLSNPQGCVGLEVDGMQGIFTYSGYWMNLWDFTWRKFAPPPLDMVANSLAPDTMTLFRGKPTVFGHPTCGDFGDCVTNEILQFDLATNTWNSLGTMNNPRSTHNVIEVPMSQCNEDTTTTTSTSTTTTTTTTTTTVTKTTPEPTPSTTVAMAVGGIKFCSMGCKG